ncbi:plasmid stabilization protein [Candidatus Peregrinibacteria bacterium CG11_big_fil_rev_8_21_14_0_20_41_10]|nr:MAG: plasmid stabilization protein [Candidatus Peregrinibacteria bacterium CG11_big_fil_rev_8_21_14_0_20_41_10]PJC38027.1 MAG: plasmid stabilization protein [Candidatus Peregrinibacteria bacterium CG_4_9_14_0_2_um_filter_41_14]
MYKLIITNSYKKRAKKFFSAHPSVIEQYEKILRILCYNPKHPSLRLHKLSGRLSGLHSVSINISYRVVVSFLLKKGQIVPIDIGSHGQT